MKIGRAQIVITGAGLVTSLGLSRHETWKNICAGQCGMREMTAMESPLPPGKDGGQALDLPEDFSPDDPREVRYLKWTIRDALRDAGALDTLPYDPRRCAFMIGTTLHGMRAAGEMLRSGGYEFLQKFLAGSTLQRATKDFHFQGPAATTCSACSSSLGSIALAVTMLQAREVDLVVAGGYDTICEYVYGGFNSLRLVANGPLRPFAKNREGMKLAEGYGIVVLERIEDAQKRNAKPQAAIVGCGESADAHHLTQPHPEGEGAARAMNAAVVDAGLAVSDIDLIAAHATGTPDNDAGEFAAMSRVFGDKLPHVPVIAFKSHLGHTLGGAGAVELILSSMALSEKTVPGTVSITRDQVEFKDLNVSLATKPAQIRATLNTSLGFGGANSCVVLTKPASNRLASSRIPSQEVFLTGIGVVLPGAVGNEAFVRRLTSESPITGNVDENEIAPLLNARRIRRMSDYVKLTLAATALALRDAGIEDVPAFAESCSAILGSTHGSATYSGTYYEQIVKQGIIGANPMLFAEGVPNAAAAHLSLMLSLKGGCQTVIGTRTAGLDALRLAWLRIANGPWDRAIVSAGEESYQRVLAAYEHAGMKFPATSGAVTFVLESERSLQDRNARKIARIELVSSASGRGNGVDAVRQVLARIGDVAHLITSSNGTWIDRAETAAMRRARKCAKRSNLHGRVGEMFSATPFAAIAAALLASNSPETFGVICTDFTGLASGVRITPCHGAS